ncbi:MAG: hypothetical protein ACLFV5_10400 [Anaerolineales bacterium]
MPDTKRRAIKRRREDDPHGDQKSEVHLYPPSTHCDIAFLCVHLTVFVCKIAHL